MSNIERWTLRGFPGTRHIDPQTTEVIAGPHVPVGEDVEVVPASQLAGAVETLKWIERFTSDHGDARHYEDANQARSLIHRRASAGLGGQ